MEEKGEGRQEDKEKKLGFLKDEIKDAFSNQEETLEFLKREEIRTMKKDLERLREIEAEQEKERILALEAKEAKKKRGGAEVISEKMSVEEDREEVVEETKEEDVKESKEPKEVEWPSKETKEEEILSEEKERIKEEIKKELEKEPGEKLPAQEEKVEKEPETEVLEEKKPKYETLIEETQIEETLIPKPIKKYSPLKKTIVRIVVVLLFFSFLAGAYWFFSNQSSFFKNLFSMPEWESPFKPEPTPKPLEIYIPPSLILADSVLGIEISNNSEIPEAIRQSLSQGLAKETFIRVIIENKEENKASDLLDISQGYGIDVVSSVIEKIDVDNFNMFLFLQKEGRRDVFIVKTNDKEGLLNQLRLWEDKIINEGLYVSGKKVDTIGSSFNDYSFEDGFSIRYLTISKEDKGICYGFFDDFLILSSSFKSIEKTNQKLKSALMSEFENRLGQFFIVGFAEKSVTPRLESFFRKYKPGGILLLSKNIKDPQQLKSLIEDLQELSMQETGLPLFVAVDQEGGPVSRIGFLKEKTAQSEINDTDTAYNVGLARGKELKDLGINVNLAPLLDDMEEEDFYFNRTFQKDPQLSGNLGKALTLGQKDAGILTVIKHFPGYVEVPFNPENKIATIPLPETSQFKTAMEAKPEMIMLANAIYEELKPSAPFTFSQTGIMYLREMLGTEILLMSDDLAQASLLSNFSLKEIVTKPIEAGIDIMIFSGWQAPADRALDAFFEAVNKGEISKNILEAAISRIVSLKNSL